VYGGVVRVLHVDESITTRTRLQDHLMKTRKNRNAENGWWIELCVSVSGTNAAILQTYVQAHTAYSTQEWKLSRVSTIPTIAFDTNKEISSF
jgi:hypothetical protein